MDRRIGETWVEWQNDEYTVRAVIKMQLSKGNPTEIRVTKSRGWVPDVVWEKAEVNWPSIGGSEVWVAQVFAAALGMAAEIADELDEKVSNIHLFEATFRKDGQEKSAKRLGRTSREAWVKLPEGVYCAGIKDVGPVVS